MHKVIIWTLALGISFGLATAAWPFNFGDVLKQLEKPPPAKPQPAPQPPAKKAAPSQPAAPPGGGSKPSGNQGGLFGILEGTGVLDKKTSNLLRGAGKVVQSLQPIGWDQERAIGGSLALEVFRRFGGPYQNQDLQRYVTLVGRSVAGVSDRADIPYHFAVLNTDNPNAFATPGGYVFVSIGLLRMVRNEAELAGVLGHEVAHIAKRHALEAIQQSKTLQGISEVSTSLLEKNPGVLANLVKEMAETLFTRGLGQEKEFEADRFGVNYAYQVGYYPGGLKDFLKILGQRKPSGSVFFSTHPSPQARFVRLSSQMRRFADATLAPTLTRRYASRTKGRLR